MAAEGPKAIAVSAQRETERKTAGAEKNRNVRPTVYSG